MTIDGHTVIDRAGIAQLTGDHNELISAPQAARILGYAHRKHLPPDLLNHADQTQYMTDGRHRRK